MGSQFARWFVPACRKHDRPIKSMVDMRVAVRSNRTIVSTTDLCITLLPYETLDITFNPEGKAASYIVRKP